MIAVIVLSFFVLVNCDLTTRRNETLQIEKSMALGGNITFSEKGEQLNELIISAKQNYYINETNNQDLKKLHEESKDYLDFIQLLPKGGALNNHIFTSGSLDYIIKNITYRKDLYANEIEGQLKFKFASKPPTSTWKLVADLRKSRKGTDEYFKYQLSERNNDEEAWSESSNIYITLKDLLTYKPVFEDYINNTLQNLLEDRVMYVEFIGDFIELYDTEGKIWKPEDTMAILVEKVQSFASQNKDFFTAKFIYAPQPDKFDSAEFKKLQEKYPNFITGYYLRELNQNVSNLLESHKEVQFQYNARRSNWKAEEELVDAVLLGASRINYAMTLQTHPALLKEIKENSVMVQICPSSEQALGLINDLRIHPANMFIAYGLPLTICNDNAAGWWVDGLTFDWFLTWVKMARRNAGLEFFKHIAINSISYSTLNITEKVTSLEILNQQWQQVDGILDKFGEKLGEAIGKAVAAFLEAIFKKKT